MAILRSSATPGLPLVVSVTGVRLGQRVLVVPGRDRRVLADLAARVGLTGRTLALADARSADAVRSAAERAGVVVDVEPLAVPFPVPDDAFDVAVVDARSRGAVETPALLPELRRALRPGGRIVVLLAAGGGLLARLLGSSAEPPAAPAILAACAAAGLRAGRLVAVRDGVGYLEATRPPD